MVFFWAGVVFIFVSTKTKNMNTVLITGASGGIGRDLAGLFAKDGRNLFLVARSKNLLEEAASDLETRYGIKVSTLVADLADLESAQHVYDSVKRAGLTIDILINNAGVGMYGSIKNMSIDRLSNMLMLNIVTLTNLTRLFASDMQQRKRGKILNMGSMVAFLPCANLAAYAASKSYVMQFSEALNAELHKDNIQVSVLNPTTTNTGFAKEANMESAKIFKKGVMSSKEVAEIGYKRFLAGDRNIVIGFGNKMQIESLRLIPRKIVAKVAAGMFKN